MNYEMKLKLQKMFVGLKSVYVKDVCIIWVVSNLLVCKGNRVKTVIKGIFPDPLISSIAL